MQYHLQNHLKNFGEQVQRLASSIHFSVPIAFVPSKNIQDNTILVHELFNSINSKRGHGGLMAVKIDMEKAFNCMEWSFILAILSKLGFAPM
jgi:hypothetical protein